MTSELNKLFEKHLIIHNRLIDDELEFERAYSKYKEIIRFFLFIILLYFVVGIIHTLTIAIIEYVYIY